MFPAFENAQLDILKDAHLGFQKEYGKENEFTQSRSLSLSIFFPVFLSAICHLFVQPRGEPDMCCLSAVLHMLRKTWEM